MVMIGKNYIHGSYTRSSQLYISRPIPGQMSHLISLPYSEKTLASIATFI
jgi:hypothetical protein